MSSLEWLKTSFDHFRPIIRRFGIDVVRYPTSFAAFPPDFDTDARDLIELVRPFTQTSPERLFALCEAVKYITVNNIPGDIVECGVWRGGSMMAVAHMLLRLQDTSRNLYLFDTFEGMPPPTENDLSYDGTPAAKLLANSKKEDATSLWCKASLDEVRQAVNGVGYDPQQIYYIKGQVEDTIPSNAPDTIALLRLDTDWYESTRHELAHLFPRISEGGVIIIDDYGHWQGARRAVDEYIAAHKIPILLNRIDYTGRIGVVMR